MTSSLLMKTLSLTGLAVVLSGCSHLAQKRTERELEMVARRWCMTIRASQIIPIYPLNEDIQPGDVFLTETPAQRQARAYNQRGYLDLEHLLVRLNPTSYPAFYSEGYAISEDGLPPRNWQFPNSGNWSNAPLAGFPTYRLQVKRGGGFNAAFPIAAIPVSLSLLSSAQATVSVQLTQAHTFGLDQASLEGPFRDWLRDNPDLILQYARSTNANSTAYLRLVTRVFVVKSVGVTVSGDAARSLGASGGAPKDVPLLSLQDTNAVANYTGSIDALNRMVESLQGSAPGGSLKLAGASAHSISLNETFDRPLVIGYIAQDYPILPDGRLGNPVSTKEVLEGRIPDPLAHSMALLREEQVEAGRIAEECVGRLERLTSDQWVPTVNAAARFGILGPLEHSQLIASADAPAARNTLAEALRRKARSGDIRARCDLLEFLEAVIALEP